MALTVQRLTEIESLRTRFLAGRGGGERPVHWAHSTELPDPWNWLGAGDLLLSNGYGVPTAPDQQVEMLTELDRAQLSGIAFSGRIGAPTLSSAAIEAANSLNFPILETAYSVPWVLLTRIVADSNTQRSNDRLIKILREYDVLRRAYHSGAASGRILTELSKECGCELRVLDVRSGSPLLVSTEESFDELRDAVLTRLRGQSSLPAFTRVAVQERSTLILPMTHEQQAVLLATPVDRDEVDLVVLQHAATIVGLEVERRAAAALRRRENGERLLHQLLTGTIGPEAALSALAPFGLDVRPWRLICWGAETAVTVERMQHQLDVAKMSGLVGHRGHEHVALLPGTDNEEQLESVVGQLGVTIGVSLPVHGLGRVGDAAREARWALEAARSTHTTFAVYGATGPLFLPQSVAEGEAVVRQILGPILAYDEANDAQLMKTLIAYFDANTTGQEAASTLGVHRQTLIYRLHRIEELTGRRVRDITDQTELFLAVRTWRMLDHQEQKDRA